MLRAEKSKRLHVGSYKLLHVCAALLSSFPTCRSKTPANTESTSGTGNKCSFSLNLLVFCLEERRALISHNMFGKAQATGEGDLPGYQPSVPSPSWQLPCVTHTTPSQRTRPSGPWPFLLLYLCGCCLQGQGCVELGAKRPGLPDRQGTAHCPLPAVPVGRGVICASKAGLVVWQTSIPTLDFSPHGPNVPVEHLGCFFSPLRGCPWEMGAGTGWLAPGEQSRRGCRAFSQPTRCSCVRG